MFADNCDGVVSASGMAGVSPATSVTVRMHIQEIQVIAPPHAITCRKFFTSIQLQLDRARCNVKPCGYISVRCHGSTTHTAADSSREHGK
jgi:hypothetical protein